ncbi:MAG: hypothetical protein GDA43_05575 [Hormoscilla sp. SP5CHS1]|nr:hypothetical protein [Hormoscilla sp. SP5CHS1]
MIDDTIVNKPDMIGENLMKLFEVALDAAIILNQSLGGLHLGSKISQFQDLVVGLGIW